MHFVTFDIDGREGSRRTDVLTGTTTNTGCLVDGRHHRRLLVILIKRHHLDSSSWTVTGTVAARHLVGDGHTVFLNPNGMTDLDRRLLNLVDQFDGSCRTYLGATCTLRTAMTTLIRHDGQHQVHQVAAGTEHLIRTL